MSADLDTHHRALTVNLDRSTFGTFAEIGAGQEVARWFLQVGGAAGTVAKAISAYDMAFSDAIYGKSGRYVSRERLLAMLDHEYAVLVARLDAERGADTRFFVFADTVAARNFAGTNECHGWMGLRFQADPRQKPSDLVLHVNMMDPTNLLQQQALGILGVNLLYAAFHDRETPERLLRSLVAGLSLERIEIDVVATSGAAFRDVDARAMALRLVRGGLANVIVIGGEQAGAPPSEILRKRPIVLERRHLGETGTADAQRLESARRMLAGECGTREHPTLSLFEVAMPAPGAEGSPDDTPVLRQVETLAALGIPVAVTRYPQWYLLSAYLRRYTKEPIRFAVDVATLVEIFERSWSESLIGGLLEGLGRLLAENVRLYVYPMPAADVRARLAEAGVADADVTLAPEGIVTADRIQFGPPLGHLLAYLREAGWLVSLAAPH